MYTYLTANPGGYQDPHHTISFSDPLVIASYGAEPIRALKEIVPRSAPPIRAETFGLRMNLSTVLAPLTWYFALLDRCQLFLVTDVSADDAGDDESLRENENDDNR